MDSLLTGQLFLGELLCLSNPMTINFRLGIENGNGKETRNRIWVFGRNRNGSTLVLNGL